MKIFEKIKTKVKTGKFKRFYLLNFCFLEISIYDCKRKIRFFPKERFVKDDKPIFYLKVNRDIDDTLFCFQNWIDILNVMHRKFCILCDNKKLEKKILKDITFYDTDFSFLKSKKYKKIVKEQRIDKKWINACFAHLTVFDVAVKESDNYFWNIDADDSFFVTDPKSAALILLRAEEYAEKKGLDAFSFDFWATKTAYKHWSFGITYTKPRKDWFLLLEKNQINWNDYRNLTSVHNIDWVFSHLKNIAAVNLSSFYVDKLYFIHFGRFLGDIKNAFIAKWENGILSHLILSDIFKYPKAKFEIGTPEKIIEISNDEILTGRNGISYYLKLQKLPL